MHFTFICLNILGLLEPWTNVTRRRMAKEALIAPIMITSESYHNYWKRGCKQTTLGVARHTLHCAARTPSSELRGQQTLPHQVHGHLSTFTVGCTTDEYTLFYTALSVQYPFQCVQFTGDRGV